MEFDKTLLCGIGSTNGRVVKQSLWSSLSENVQKLMYFVQQKSCPKFAYVLNYFFNQSQFNGGQYNNWTKCDKIDHSVG